MGNSWREGVLKVKILEATFEAKLEFPGGQGCKTKSLLWGGGGGYGYFLELHNVLLLAKLQLFTDKCFRSLDDKHTSSFFLTASNLFCSASFAFFADSSASFFHASQACLACSQDSSHDASLVLAAIRSSLSR